VPELATLLETEWTEDHKLVVAALIATKSPLAVPALRRALEGKDEITRARAAEGLGKLGDTSKDTLSVLVRAVEDRMPRVRRAAIDALGRLKPATREAVAAVRQATTDTDASVRERAAIVLKKLVPKPKKAKTKKTP
jgi:HEAT repeat protein